MTSPTPRIHQIAVSVALFVLLAATGAAYLQGLPGFFLLDDFNSLRPLSNGVETVADALELASSGIAGPTGRPISLLSFLVDDNGWPSDAGTFKRTNIWLHLIAGCLVFAFARLAVRTQLNSSTADWLALTAAGLWLTSPLHVSTVLYVIQRMTQLSTIFVLCGLIGHLTARTALAQHPKRSLLLLTASLAAFGLLATFSKESGALLVVYIAVLELTIFANSNRGRAFAWWRRIFIYAPCLALIAYLIYSPLAQPIYENRAFTLSQRLITEPVVLVGYLRSALTLTVYKLGLFHDDYPIFSSLLEWRPALSLALLAAVTAMAWRSRKTVPLAALGPLWFLGGHLLESTTLPLEVYFEHRNYAPLIGIWVSIIWMMYSVLMRAGQSKVLMDILAAGFIAISATVTAGHASEWRSKETLLSIWAAEHPDSPRAQRSYALVLAEQGMVDPALDYLDDIYAKFPTDLSVPLISLEIACQTGRPLRYGFNALAAQLGNHEYSDGLFSTVDTIAARILDNSCAPQTEAFHQLLRQLPNLRNASRQPNRIAELILVDGNLYLRQGNGNGALGSFLIVDELAPSESSALRVADLFVRAGIDQEALKYLDIAEKRASAGARPFAKEAIHQRYAAKRQQLERQNPDAGHETAPSPASDS